MTMSNQQNQQVLRLLCSAHDLLGDVIERKNWIDDLEKIAVALTNMRIALRKMNVENFRYADVLEIEEYYLRNKWIDIFNPLLCGCESITFKSARSSGNTFVFIDDEEKKKYELPAKYEIGNRAIGQVFVDGKEGFCQKIATEHSAESIAYRWYACSRTIITNLDSFSRHLFPFFKTRRRFF